MADRKVYHVSPHEDGWQVKGEGAERASNVLATKDEAVARARELAKGQGEAQIIIHTGDGQIETEHTSRTIPTRQKGNGQNTRGGTMRQAGLLTLFEYSAWATERLLDAAARLDAATYFAPAEGYPALHDTLVHAYAAGWVWRQRCGGISPTALPGVAEIPTLEALRAAWQAENDALLALVAGLSDEALEGVVSYRTTTGKAHQNALWQLLAHLVNHGTQHRSEAAMLLTARGQSPGDLDLITFLRARQGA